MYMRFNQAGLFSVGRDLGNHRRGSWELHFFVKPSHWIWGHETEEYDCIMEYYGLGPLFLLCVMN